MAPPIRPDRPAFRRPLRFRAADELTSVADMAEPSTVTDPARPAAEPMVSSCELSIVLPCLNEAETLAVCIRKALASLDRLELVGEVIVADNGSTDGSQAIATEEGARVVPVARRGYGAALRGGIEAARGTYVLMADADDSYALDDLGAFVQRLRGGWSFHEHRQC